MRTARPSAPIQAPAELAGGGRRAQQPAAESAGAPAGGAPVLDDPAGAQRVAGGDVRVVGGLGGTERGGVCFCVFCLGGFQV